MDGFSAVSSGLDSITCELINEVGTYYICMGDSIGITRWPTYIALNFDIFMRVNLTWADGQTRDYDMGKKIHQWYDKKKKKTLLMKNIQY